MSEPAASDRRPRVLLLAGGVRDAWAGALSASGFEVATTGWLDGVTAARLRRPDVVLVSTDLPAGAPGTLCTAFRSAGDLARIPLVVAGEGADRLDAETLDPFRADRYLPAPSSAEAVATAVRAAQREGRWELPLRVRIAALALTLVGLAAIVAHASLRAAGHDASAGQAFGWPGALPLLVFVAAFAAAAVILVRARPRPISALEWRSLLGTAGMWIWMAGVFVPDRLSPANLAPSSLALAAWSVWAWLGPRVKRRGRSATAWLRALAVALALLALAPWVALAWLRA